MPTMSSAAATAIVPTTRLEAIDRYLAVAPRLPLSHFPTYSEPRDDLQALTDEFDAFVLDGFGVLNVGGSAVPGAVECVRALQSAGKRVLVLTNGATMPATSTPEKYAAWGFEFDPADIISSRDALAKGLQTQPAEQLWGFAAPSIARIETLAHRAIHLGDKAETYEAADGFVLLSTADWNMQRQTLLQQALARRSRPVLVGNPDLVAPWEGRLSIEPGFFAHALADAGVAEPVFYGKPFANVFELAAMRLHGVPGHRIAMVGDTLHTDILGGAAFGWRTVLVHDHGLFRGIDPQPIMEACGIRPDFICRTT